MTTSEQPVEATSGVRRAVALTADVLAVLATAGIAALMLLIVVDVTRRTLFSRSVPGAVEASEMLLVAVVFLGLGFAERQRAHVSVSLFVRTLPTRVARPIELAIVLLSLAIVGWMTWETASVAIDSVQRGETRSGLVRVPLWPGRVAIPLGLAVFGLQLLVRAIDLVTRRRAPIQEVQPETNI
jgi:TRAP-type transport system small permease protein